LELRIHFLPRDVNFQQHVVRVGMNYRFTPQF